MDSGFSCTVGLAWAMLTLRILSGKKWTVQQKYPKPENPKCLAHSCHLGAFTPGGVLSMFGHDKVPFMKMTGFIK